jgi:hypothetical protein
MKITKSGSGEGVKEYVFFTKKMVVKKKYFRKKCGFFTRIRYKIIE